MPRRAVSPTPSDGEVDIADALFNTNADDSGSEGGQDAGFDFDGILNGGGEDDGEEDGDAAFIALQQAASFRKSSNLKGKSVKKGGGFQAMGLNANLLRAITKKGFSVPTPIQRKTIPIILDRKDVVGMARTGSGKTAAFVIPMIERLRAHSAKIGTRALILSPSRELALQTLKVVKEFSKGTDLKCVLLVGGDSMEEQFGFMSSNPDIVIATPGRFLHLKVEMGLDLSSIKYVVFDEADRLFEMGFAAQLTEILHSLPPSRQSLLFSATLPASLVEFARAGLQDPSLIRLDAETKVSPDLESAFFSVKGAEKEAALLHILHDIIKMPMGTPDGIPLDIAPSKKRKRGEGDGRGKPTEHSTIIFAATKHHVEYLAQMLIKAGFAVSYVYGSLDQEARRINTENFRQGRANILVVTDVAARGIDIPVLANVINYDFPPQPKVFVHRVGRTARAGQRGWAYSIVRELDTPYLLDLQLFLGRKLVIGHESEKPSFAEDVVVGGLSRDRIEMNMEWMNKILKEESDIEALRSVSVKAEKLYLKTRHSASYESAKRAREIVGSRGWNQLHPLFGAAANNAQQARNEMMAKISGFRPAETIFEIGRGGKGSNSEAVEVMKQLRKRITPHRGNKKDDKDSDAEMGDFGNDNQEDDENSDEEADYADAMEAYNSDNSDDNDGLEVTISNADEGKGKKKKSKQPDNRPSPPGGLLSSPIFRRDGYRPMPSGSIDHSPLDGVTENQHVARPETSYSQESDPLGISVKGIAKRVSFTRVPVGSKSSSPVTPRFNNGFPGLPESGIISPRAQSGPASLAQNPDQDIVSPLEETPVSSPNSLRTAARIGKSPMPWDDPPRDDGSWDPSSRDEIDLGRVNPSKDAHRQDATSVGSDVDNNSVQMRNDHDAGNNDSHDDDETFYKRYSHVPHYCDSRKDVHRRRANWLSISIIALSIYSTGLSCLWFVVAVVQPRWGPTISSSGGIAPSTATMVCAMFAKTIEISFVTVFVAFIGQVLTRRSFVKTSKGMTLAEMTMRNWVIQPGFMLTHWETLPYAAVTFLGAVSLIATIASTFYTTASDVMVSPKLKYGGWESKALNGYVLSSYANTFATQDSCPTPLRKEDPNGPEFAARSCLDIQYAGQSYRNLVSFLTVWDEINHNGTGASLDMSHRPVGTTLLYDNTTLTTTWVKTEYSNVTRQFEEKARIIHNVTLAMPHPGVYDAATNPVNKILQPNDLSGVGEYAIRASVVSPVINVMCVNMDEEELAPLVYTKWEDGKTNATGVGNQTTGWAGWEGEVPHPEEDEWLNRTTVDEIFRWGPTYGRRPPVFQLYPADFNMITNTTVYQGDAIYLLAKSASITNYTLCEMRSWVTPNCSTHFNISGTAGSHMQAHCEDPDDPDRYDRSVPDVTPEKPDGDWKNIADQWRLSMDINGGTVNNNASNARTLTQFILEQGKLNPLLPSMAEALAVFASSTLVIGSIGSPFIHYWDYETMQLGEPGALATFNATIRTQEYTSSHEYEWQNVFYLALVLVLLINIFCLGYFLSRSGLVTDYTEPQNLFALAVNSPPSEQLKGSCGGGPIKRDFVVPWKVAYAKGPNHYFFEEANGQTWRKKQDASAETEYQRARERSSYKRLSTSRTWF